MLILSALLAVSTLLAAGEPAHATPPAAQETDPAGSAQEVPEVVVGAHAGPRMWKITQGDHVLWILGTVTPLPKKLTWQSSAVEAVLKESQEVVPGWPSFGIGWNPITMVRLYFEWRRLQKNPDSERLAQVLPPDLYVRFEALRARYAPRDYDIEKLRPMIAAQRLLEETLDASGLTYRNEVQQTVLHLARHDGVRIHQDQLKVEQPVETLKDISTVPREAEISCLEAVISRLETDLGPMQVRARAWALGDVETLRKLSRTEDRIACVAAVSNSERVKDLIERTIDDWTTSVEDGLSRNRSTLAVQTMDRLLGDDGALATLRKRGYTIEGP
jgi:uncharacterized protein YbaP (TraB family)